MNRSHLLTLKSKCVFVYDHDFCMHHPFKTMLLYLAHLFMLTCTTNHRIFDRALARRGNLFLQVDLLYEPTITSGTIVSIRGSGMKRNPWSAKIAVPSTAGIVAGMMLSATDGTGSIFGQTKSGDPESRQVSSPESVVVTSVEHDTSITYEVIGGTTGDVFEDQIPVLGSITNIVGYYEDPLPVVKYILMPGSS
jgi:hypothetical protein